MEIPEAVSVRKFKEFNATQKDEVYETLLDLAEAIEEIPKKSLRKTLDLTLAVLTYKGTQVTTLQGQLEAKIEEENSIDSHNERLLDENEKLKRMLDKLEDEKSALKNKLKEFTDEIYQLQKRLQEAANTAEASDKDSSDPLSELDKQEELLRNINIKNKHIKRLLREIEALQTQNIEQSKTIINIERELQEAKARELQLSADITLVDSERKALKQTGSELRIEILRLEGNVTYLEEDREKSERELKEFIEKLELKAQSWKDLLDQKNNELKKLRARLEKEGGVLLSSSESANRTEAEAAARDEAELMGETTKMMHAIESRDKLIEQLELKIKTMAEEMITSTKIMNKLSAEREDERNPHKPRDCCRVVEEALQTANERCCEMSEMLERSEEDNALKAKQAMQAMTALNAYQSGEDGLVKALRKCSALEQKIVSRDKQIRALIMELNLMHEIAQENGILRKRLNIPDDVIISAKNLVAKERQKDKIIERLTLKLRSSEEMRLQLKLEKSDLRKELLLSQQAQQKPIETQQIVESSSGPSEIGEVEDSLPVAVESSVLNTNICQNCQGKLDLKFSKDDDNQPENVELLIKYQEVLEENETLRLGMLEILEKLREYDDCSDHITIDTAMLYRLLQNLQRRSANDVPQHLQLELQDLKQRERALREFLKQEPQAVDTETDELESVDEMREGDNERRCSEESILQLPDFVDSSTRPTTANKSLNQTSIPIILDEHESEKKRDLELELGELQIYRKHYEELKIHMAACEQELARNCAELVEQVRRLETELNSQNSRSDFMREDFDMALSQAKQSELRHMQQVADLGRELLTQKQQIEEYQLERQTQRMVITYTAEEYETLLKDKAALQAQVARFVAQVLNGELMPELQINDICMDYGIIDDNMQVHYITTEEYERQIAELKEATEKRQELCTHAAQLEGLLEIAQEQIQSQQKLLNEITDNHINLRHLVADLQSTTEAKFVLAKMQRDLDSANFELDSLKSERAELKQKHDQLQMNFNAEQLRSAKLNKDFQSDLQNRNIKIKFLQKALYALKEKYTKFTPLIFLTNFVFAYNQFVKKTKEITDHATDQNILEKVTAIVQCQLEANNFNPDESQNVIKLIKTESQCKLLEEDVSALQKKCKDLQQELTEQRIRFANDTEHWQTIEALFGAEPTTEKSANTEESIDTTIVAKVQLQLMDAATNTDEAPMPAQRKISADSADGRRDTRVVETLDKNTSPIGSPLKKSNQVDKGIQTDAEAANGESKAVIEAEPELQQITTEESITVDETGLKKLNDADKSDTAETTIVKKFFSNALVQTSTEHMESQAVQTMNLQATEPQDSKDFERIELQLKEARRITEEREQLLRESQQNLLKANQRIEDLKLLLENATTANREVKSVEINSQSQQETSQQSGIIEKTIISFHTLLTEKDKSISKYQDLLQSEREQTQTGISKLQTETVDLKNTITHLNFNINTKDIEIFELKTKLEAISVRRNSIEKLDLATGAVGIDESGDNSLNELTDEKIEEMFQQDTITESEPRITLPAAEGTEEKQDTETLKEIPSLLKQIKELKDKASYGEQSLRVKEEELTLLKQKVSLYEEREKSVNQNANSETEQLRMLLEDKDKHINDLMETLNNFHDDQQRYITDSSNDSADRITKLAANLTRTEATNKIYQTQVEALRRQLASLTQREKQARDLSQSLRTQLIKRPVVSIKTELNARVKQEHMQKRIQQLELELEEVRAQLQRQQIVIEAKRARSVSEVGLWEKQKRWQQSAEKFKAKLEETEGTLEKTRSLLQTARNTIARLEKDKQVLEVRLGRATQSGSGSGVHHIKCCRTPSCPNLQQGRGASSAAGGKYTPSESPETYTGASSECSSPAHSASATCGARSAPFYAAAVAAAQAHPHNELIEALKARIELQQRKILAMELEGKGSNALTTEMEKLQERCSAIEAQNIRLEARNLQLQLDNDLLRQGDASERLQKRIKHLEDYIIALKEERAQAEARRELCKCSGIRVSPQPGRSAEQTILSLRGIVEKLRAENKYLKDARRPCELRSFAETPPPPAELNKLQQMYSESLEKISALQIEMNIKAKCAKCGSCGKLETHINDELKYTKEQLIKKTQLLQKAKVLLTRAAAKEKVLKEQLALWKRKCFELQNVPVIEEISE